MGQGRIREVFTCLPFQIDGDCYNNNLTNLQVLCPNCHAMTENYGRRNTKSTRKKRYKNT